MKCFAAALIVVLVCAIPAAGQDCVNINTAPASELERIIHIGPARAQEIIQKRPFSSVDDLTRVSGIGAARLADIKAEGIASVNCNTTPTPSPTPSPSPAPPAATDRITFQFVSRQVLPDALRVTLTTGEAVTIPSSELVYVRDEWPHWRDDDGDCQDARQEVLIAESRTPAVLDTAGCRVLSGWWIDPLTGQEFTDPSDLDVDHHVPLAHAFRSGGWAWDRDARTRFANYLADPWHLNALGASTNRSKGDKAPDEWKPPQRSAWCTYARDWRSVKQRWLLTISAAEQRALDEMLATCGP